MCSVYILSLAALAVMLDGLPRCFPQSWWPLRQWQSTSKTLLAVHTHSAGHKHIPSNMHRHTQSTTTGNSEGKSYLMELKKKLKKNFFFLFHKSQTDINLHLTFQLWDPHIIVAWVGETEGIFHVLQCCSTYYKFIFKSLEETFFALSLFLFLLLSIIFH